MLWSHGMNMLHTHSPPSGQRILAGQPMTALPATCSSRTVVPKQEWLADEEQSLITEHQAPAFEIQEAHPLGYLYYTYFDMQQAKVNGIPLRQPFWQHNVAIPTMFFNDDHIEEIRIPIVCSFIHTLGGARFYANLFWLDWQYQSNKPLNEAIQLHTKLFELRGRSSHLNLSIEDLHVESARNPAKYTPEHIAQMYVLISRWDAPVTLQGCECQAAQREDHECERASMLSFKG